MKRPEEILKDNWNITPDTKFHSYASLYRSIVKAMKEYAEQELLSAGVITRPSKEFIESMDSIEKALKKGKPTVQEYPIIELKNPNNPNP